MTEQQQGDGTTGPGQQGGYGQAPGYGQPPAPGFGQPPSGWGQGAPQNGKGTVALVLGIVSIVLFWVPFLYLVTSVPAGIVAIVQGNKGKALAREGRATNGGQAQAGVVCGTVGLMLCAVNAVAGALLAL